MIKPQHLVGNTEIAKIARCSRTLVCVWRSRYPTFPKPVVELAMGPVYSLPEILKWLRNENVITEYEYSCSLGDAMRLVS